MINEVLFMEMRVFREFCRRMRMSAKEANALFTKHRIWSYIETCYDSLLLSGDECVLDNSG